MNLKDYLSNPESKYAVIRLDSYTTDPVAQSLTQSPRSFMFGGVEMAIISLDPDMVAMLAAYAEQAANGVEFELTVGSGKVTLLTHSQISKLLYDLD